MEVQIISKKFIKPSSPTPEHLKTHKLSFLDQFYPTIYIPMILYYPTNQSNANEDTVPQKLQQFRQSLSETLTRFYPLAGRIKDNLTIDCNDEGASFVEARVDSNLLDFLKKPNPSELSKFLPQGVALGGSCVGEPVASIQVTSFACGGVVVGVYLSHMVADGTAMSAFLKAWAATSRSDEVIIPSFEGSSIFPQDESFPADATMMGVCGPFFRTGKCGLRRFLFNANAIATLKEKVESSGVPNPTRVEVMSALMWKTMASAINANSGLQRPSVVTHAVNLRRRANPPYPESFMGDFIAVIAVEGKPEDQELASLVRQIRGEIVQFNADFVRSIEGEKGFIKYTKLHKEMTESFNKNANSSEGLEYAGLSSWCNFGLYEVDFGWGKPEWVTSVGGSSDDYPVFFNVAIFMDTRTRDEVEVWLFLKEEELCMVDKNEELLSLVSVNPSPLDM